ncbi:putative inner membrane protein [Escherichia coli]|uniref:Putative inner membrane protein n=1 Tax=Escherichia coli TaxID=562 RepID=A0A376DEG2_ECOLX|nr:putative inner membrane protein [Escherichia coli]
MKWQQRVRVATGLSCWQIMLHLLVVALLVVGWMSKTPGSRRRRIMRTVLCHGSDDAGVSAPPRATLA